MLSFGSLTSPVLYCIYLLPCDLLQCEESTCVYDRQKSSVKWHYWCSSLNSGSAAFRLRAHSALFPGTRDSIFGTQVVISIAPDKSGRLIEGGLASIWCPSKVDIVAEGVILWFSEGSLLLLALLRLCLLLGCWRKIPSFVSSMADLLSLSFYYFVSYSLLDCFN